MNPFRPRRLRPLLLAGLGFLLTTAAAAADWRESYAALLDTYVEGNGVRYAAWHADEQDLARLEGVVEAIGMVDPQSLDRDARLAFYINAYNAWMLHLVLQAYPVKSVTGIEPDWGVFSKKLITIDGQPTSLDHLEKQLILKTIGEPRAHFAVNCASVGCPPLQPEPFSADNLERQLEAVTKAFVNTPLGVRVEGDTVSVSKIFHWYQDDFAPAGGVLAFVRDYHSEPLPQNPRLTYHDYNWSLNAAD